MTKVDSFLFSLPVWNFIEKSKALQKQFMAQNMLSFG
jgi:hypothetical protein